MKRGLTSIELIVLLASAGLCAVILLPAGRWLSRGREIGCGQVRCASNLKQLGLGLTLYAQDAGERLPPVAFKSAQTQNASPRGWVDALMPYIKSTQVFRCPASQSRGVTDYFFNLHLWALDTRRIAHPSRVVLLAEGNPAPKAPGDKGSDARYALRGFPQGWARDEDSPLHRHREIAPGGFLLFADGHVKFHHLSPPPELPTLLFSFRPRLKYLEAGR